MRCRFASWHQIGTEEEFGEALRYAATLIPVERVRVALLGDGAKWIWKHLKAAFPTGKEILDYYHCSLHVREVAKAQYGNDEYEQVMWIESVMARLNFGEVESVIWGLQRMKPSSGEARKEIEKLIEYLRNNAHRINYESFKRGQYPRGSGGIESANKFISSCDSTNPPIRATLRGRLRAIRRPTRLRKSVASTGRLSAIRSFRARSWTIRRE